MIHNIILTFTGSSLGTDQHNCTIEISPVGNDAIVGQENLWMIILV